MRANSYTYDPFGVTTETKATLTNVFNPWRYTGQYQDTSTGMYTMGARYYQRELGRWTQRDPLGQEANPYLYVAGNPVNFADPSGLVSVSEIFQGISYAPGAAGLVAVGASFPPGLILGLGSLGLEVRSTIFGDSDCKGASIIRDVLQFNFTGGVNGAFNAGLAKGFATVTQVVDFVASAAINKLGFACP